MKSSSLPDPRDALAAVASLHAATRLFQLSEPDVQLSDDREAELVQRHSDRLRDFHCKVLGCSVDDDLKRNRQNSSFAEFHRAYNRVAIVNATAPINRDFSFPEGIEGLRDNYLDNCTVEKVFDAYSANFNSPQDRLADFARYLSHKKLTPEQAFIENLESYQPALEEEIRKLVKNETPVLATQNEVSPKGRGPRAR